MTATTRGEGAKYRKLLRTITVENDRATYGEYYDYGYWSGTAWKDHKDLPPGYWVYVAPQWYIFGECAAAQAAPALPAQKRSWGPEQVIGPPDTPSAGDKPTAWASRTADGQDEWLRLHYARAVVPSAVHVYETWNPGALYRITAQKPDGSEVEIWSGNDPVKLGSGMGVAAVPVKADFATDCVTIYLKSTKVPGWNEIDAVGLMDRDEKIQWAVSVEASSSWADLASESVRDTVVVSPTTNARISQLEAKVRQLNGEVEELRQEVKKLEGR
jgi:hypothetical protein